MLCSSWRSQRQLQSLLRPASPVVCDNRGFRSGQMANGCCLLLEVILCILSFSGAYISHLHSLPVHILVRTV